MMAANFTKENVFQLKFRDTEFNIIRVLVENNEYCIN